jgi:hypothetical protein
VLKNSFQGISPVKFVRKLLNIRSPQAWKIAEFTGLVPFSTATRDFAHNADNERCRRTRVASLRVDDPSHLIVNKSDIS